MIGEVLRVVRIANDMHIKDVSEKSNISISYLTDLEKNNKKNPSMKTLKNICLVNNLNVSDIFELDEYHESIIGLKDQLKIYQLLLIKVLELYNTKEKKLVKEYVRKDKIKTDKCFLNSVKWLIVEHNSLTF